jgi:mono/diheme cytochrome c family protein
VSLFSRVVCGRSGVALALFLAIAAPSTVVAADTPLTTRQAEGKKLYDATCRYCHSEKMWGTLAIERRRGASDALLEKRTDLVPAFVKSVVRNGLGSMPAYRRTELTDAEIDAIVAYLTRTMNQ